MASSAASGHQCEAHAFLLQSLPTAWRGAHSSMTLGSTHGSISAGKASPQAEALRTIVDCAPREGQLGPSAPSEAANAFARGRRPCSSIAIAFLREPFGMQSAPTVAGNRGMGPRTRWASARPSQTGRIRPCHPRNAENPVCGIPADASGLTSREGDLYGRGWPAAIRRLLDLPRTPDPESAATPCLPTFARRGRLLDPDLRPVSSPPWGRINADISEPPMSRVLDRGAGHPTALDGLPSAPRALLGKRGTTFLGSDPGTMIGASSATRSKGRAGTKSAARHRRTSTGGRPLHRLTKASDGQWILAHLRQSPDALTCSFAPAVSSSCCWRCFLPHSLQYFGGSFRDWDPKARTCQRRSLSV